MTTTIEAIFDGKNLQLEEPLVLAVGTRVRITVEPVSTSEIKQPKAFLQTAQSLDLEGNPDWSEKVDQYLYEEQKNNNA